MSERQTKQAELGASFQALHRAEGGFVIPNPWDPGSARLLEILGFKALASTSAGFAFSIGMADNTVQRHQKMEHLRQVCEATTLPVSADLENGFEDSPAGVALTIQLAAEAGVVGASIEDSTGLTDSPQYDVGLAKERIAAAVEAARALPFAFTLTARAENFFVGRPDLADTISRLQAYQEAGADVLFAPGLTRLDDIASVVRSVDRPLNVMAGFSGFDHSVADLLGVGVKRVSVGASLARAAIGEFLRAATELREFGTTHYVLQATPGGTLNKMFARI